jgi:hypothetical protein
MLPEMRKEPDMSQLVLAREIVSEWSWD